MFTKGGKKTLSNMKQQIVVWRLLRRSAIIIKCSLLFYLLLVSSEIGNGPGGESGLSSATRQVENGAVTFVRKAFVNNPVSRIIHRRFIAF